MPRIQGILRAGDKTVMVLDGSFRVSFDEPVMINGSVFHAIPPSGSIDDSFAIADREIKSLPSSFFIGSTVERIKQPSG